jgi:hypothetical protein
MESTTESGEVRVPTPGNGHTAEPAAPQQAPVTAPPPIHGGPAIATSSQSATAYERCSACGSLVAIDQRYCIECGRRRGEPRLPFMDAVVFMDAMNRPTEPSAPPKERKRRLSPNTALIAGVGTLLLALGIGVLIGRSGDHGATQAAAPPQIVTVEGGGEAAAQTSPKGGETFGGASTKGKSKKQVVEAKMKAAETGEGAKSVLHAVPGANLPPPTVKVGGKCEKKVAGCNEKGEFDGSFFGGEE